MQLLCRCDDLLFLAAQYLHNCMRRGRRGRRVFRVTSATNIRFHFQLLSVNKRFTVMAKVVAAFTSCSVWNIFVIWLFKIQLQQKSCEFQCWAKIGTEDEHSWLDWHYRHNPFSVEPVVWRELINWEVDSLSIFVVCVWPLASNQFRQVLKGATKNRFKKKSKLEGDFAHKILFAICKD